MYSDLGLSLNILIDAINLYNLYQDLNTEFQLEQEWEEVDPEAKVEYRALINVSFSRGKGHLKNEIPDVPG